MFRSTRNPRKRISRPDYVKYVVIGGFHRYLFFVRTSPFCTFSRYDCLKDFYSIISLLSQHILRRSNSQKLPVVTERVCADDTVVYRWVRSAFRLPPIYTGLTTVNVPTMAIQPHSVSFDLIRLRNLSTSTTYGDSPVLFALEVVGALWTRIGHAHTPYVQ